MGWIRLRHAGYDRGFRCLRLFRRPANSHLAWHRGRTPGSAGSPGRDGDRGARFGLPLFHRLFSCCGLLRGKPLASIARGARPRLWRSVWCGRLLFHESHRGAVLRCEEICILLGNDVPRSCDPHRLRWSSHRSAGPAILDMNTVPQCPFDLQWRPVPVTMLSGKFSE